MKNTADWKSYYKSRIVSADEAVRVVKSHDRVVDGHGPGQPTLMREAMVRRAGELQGVEVITGFNLGNAEYCRPEYAKNFVHNSVFNNPTTRQANWEGRAEFTPSQLSEMDRLFTTKLPVDVLFTHVTGPDENGYVSMGIDVSFTRAVLDNAKVVVAQVNRNMPWTYGDGVVHVTDIDQFVEGDVPLPEIPEADNISAVERAIANHIATLINDGDTIQTGVGAIPDTVLSLLGNHKNIGIHTELASTGIMRMIEKGVIDNSRKTLDQGKVVCTLMGGTRAFYDYVDHNPTFEMHRSSYVNSPLVIARQKNMVAMNSAIQVDLFGQVCADMIGPRQFSGVGGQLDFLRGAAMAEGGKSIICLPATAAKGTISRIVSSLDAGAAVTDTRYDVMYIVTEFGIADLWGKTNTARAKELIRIAHPKFREQLEKEYYEKIYRVV